MSRCFPFPPPRYLAKRDSNEALIDSIKLQRERERGNAERKKESKREKKLKKREKEANAKQNVNECSNGKKRKLNDEKTQKRTKESIDLKGKYIQRSGEDEAEQLERSGLTEEHGQPVSSQNTGYLSDSTQNSDKRRRRQTSPVNGISAHGSILRIRLPSQKHKGSDIVVSKERLSLTSGRTDSAGQLNSKTGHGHSQEEFCSTSMGTGVCMQGVTPGPDKEQGCSTSGGTGVFAQDDMQTAAVATSVVKETRIVDTLYKDLVENWVPTTLHREQTDVDEQEWLFQRKHQERERSKSSSNDSCTGGSTLWSHAQYLPEVDIFALPFAVPL